MLLMLLLPSVFIKREVLLFYGSVAESGEDGRNGPIGVFELPVEPQVDALVLLLLFYVFLELF